MFEGKYVGKRDIHEEKIIESDIIKFKTTLNKEELEGIVYFNQDSAAFEISAVDIHVDFSFNQVYDIEIIQ